MRWGGGGGDRLGIILRIFSELPGVRAIPRVHLIMNVYYRPLGVLNKWHVSSVLMMFLLLLLYYCLLYYYYCMIITEHVRYVLPLA